jgi:broad specificity phosphatase PhoE
MKHLYFCRHGESQLNVEKRWAGSSETPLTTEGRQQAKQAGQNAKALGIEYILCSPLSRAQDTAKIIAEEIGYPEHDIDVNSLVMERHFGELEGMPWEPDFNMDGISDAETTDSILERVKLTLKHLQTLPVDTVLIVSHGHFGRVLRHILSPDIPLHGSERFENAKIVKLL